MSIVGKNPSMMVLDDLDPILQPPPVIHPVLRVRPVTKALWNIYGPPPLARWLLTMAFDEVLSLEAAFLKKGRR